MLGSSTESVAIAKIRLSIGNNGDDSDGKSEGKGSD